MLEFIIVIIIILMHGIAYYSVHSCSPYVIIFFHNPHHRHYISIRQIVCMFMLCIAYWYVSLCCSTDLQWYVKIATPTALSASALRPGIFQSVAQLLYRSLRQRHVSFAPEHAPAFHRHASQGASLVARVCCGGKSALRWVQTSNDTCIVYKVNCAGCKIGPIDFDWVLTLIMAEMINGRDDYWPNGRCDG